MAGLMETISGGLSFDKYTSATVSEHVSAIGLIKYLESNK
jgi:hypothetical protein